MPLHSLSCTFVKVNKLDFADDVSFGSMVWVQCLQGGWG